MNRVKFALLAAGFALALALTFSACSSDSDDGKPVIGTCTGDGDLGSICTEYHSGISAKDAQDDCEEGEGDVWEAEGSCPGNSALKCSFKEKGAEFTIYLYSSLAQNRSCDNVFGEDED